MKRTQVVFAFVVFVLWLSSSASLFAQASLAAENCINDVTVTVDGTKDSYTCIRDGMKEDQWYYVPNRPRLATTGKDQLPVFHLLKYQAKDPNDATGKTLVEGGILQLAIKIAAPDGAVDQMREFIGKAKGIDPKKLQLGALPINSAQVTLYAPDGNMITSEPQMPGIAPAFANQEIPFQVKFNKLGADVYEALVKGGGGLPILVSFAYNGLTPPLGFKIEANWDQTFNHFSHEEKAKANFGGWFWGGSVESTTSFTNETTLKNMGIKVSKIAAAEGAGGPTSQDLQAVIDPILKRIGEEIVEDMKPFDKVEPAAAKDVNPRSGAWFSGGVSFALKSVNKRKHGTENWEWNEQQVIERHTTCGSVIGLGNYPKEIQDKLITIMPAGNWAAAYYTLPAVGDDPSLGIKQIDLSVVPVDKTKKQIPNVKQETAVWTPDNAEWVDPKTKQPINFLLFAMQGVYAKYSDKQRNEELKYQVKLKISTAKDVINLNYLEDMIDGDIPVSTPMDVIEPIVVNADWVTFAQKGAKEGLAGVSISMTPAFPKKTYNITLKNDSPTLVPCFLVEKEQEGKKNPIKCKIDFVKIGGQKVPWKYSTSADIRQDAGTEIFLWDKDFETSGKK